MSEDSNQEIIFRYHSFSKHSSLRSAPGPGYLDWSSQPDPFRRYEGSRIVTLKKIPPEDKPTFSDALQGQNISISPVSFESVSQLFFDSMAISAWKSFQGNQWALRVNPSSGNLHPTEAYLLCGPIKDLSLGPALFHYCPKIHALEKRGQFSESTWKQLMDGLPEGAILIGVSSIYWRESWKYGLRAFRYCHHDVGHALAAINLACAGLGWQARMLDHLSRDSVQNILGLTEPHEGEEEIADCLIAVWPTMDFPKFSKLDWQKDLAGEPDPGEPNALSGSHVDWSGITEVSHASEKPFTGDYPVYKKCSDTSSHLIADNVFPFRKAIHQRRSAVSMDGRTSISQETFYQFMIQTVPTMAPATFQSIPWEPQVHLGLFVHRVDGLPSGLYCLVRNPDHLKDLQDKMNPDFHWQKPDSCPPELELFFLEEGDFENHARAVSCGQDIAADGCFSLGMLSAFNDPLQKYGPWFYPRLYWECGAIGQILYLQAEVSGIRSTGIGCFFDDSMHDIFGIQDQSYQSLYHFTVGGPVEDTRLTTLPAY